MIKVEKLNPFGRMCISLGMLPSSYKESLTYEEQLLWFMDFLENNVIPTVNNNADAVIELQNYVSHYFDNLDVQQEINNKLDEMAEDGSLGTIISTYITPIQDAFEERIENQIDTLEGQQDAFEERIENQIDTLETNVENQIDVINTKVDASIGIYPTPVDSVEDMSDTTKVYVNTTDGYWYYYDSTNETWTQGGLYQSTSDSTHVQKLREEMSDINGNVIVDDLLEIGNIAFSNSGWTYSSSTTRVRTKEGVTISLKVGDTIEVTNENMQFYCGFLMPNDAYDTPSQWLSSKYTVRCCGDYALLFRFTGEQEAITSINEVLPYIKITRNNKITQLNQVNEIIKNGSYLKQTIINDIDQGGTFADGYKMYSWGKLNTSRFAHKDSILSSKPIVIEMSDGYEIAGQRWSGAEHTQANYFDETGWKKQIIINANEYCSFQIRKANNQAFADNELNFSDYMNIYYLDDSFKPNYNLSNIKSVNHRGYNSIAPENTIPAFKLSKAHGYNMIETDLRLTSDGVVVLLHDATIDRTSNGEGAVASMTYEQLLQYDFGSWKSETYAGTKIPTLEELLILARNIDLHCYLELIFEVNFTQEIVNNIIDLIESYGLLNKVTFTSMKLEYLQMVKNKNRNIRLAYVPSNNENVLQSVDKLQSLKTEKNEVFYSGDFSAITSTKINRLKFCKVPYETWPPDQVSQIVNADPYISGFINNVLVAEEVLYNNEMN